MNKNVKIFLAYVGIIFIFFGRNILTTYMHSDFIAYWVPHYKFLIDSLKEGIVPLWQPYSYLGLPELFKTELVFFYPLAGIVVLINLIFNQSSDFTFLGKTLEILSYVNLVLGAFGMYLLLEKIYKLKTLAAFFGGIVFSLSMYISIQGGDLSSMPGKLILPWIFLFLIRFLQSPTFKSFLFVVGINYILLTLGYPYNYVYFFIAQISLALYFGFKRILMVLIALGNSVLMAGYFMLPNFHILSQSFRGGNNQLQDPLFHFTYSYIPTKLITIFNPIVFSQLYDPKDPQLLFSMGMLTWGVIPLIFMLYGFSKIKKNTLFIWTTLVFIFGFIISLGAYLDVPNVLGVIIPIIHKFRSHAQVLSLTFFSGTIILSYGLHLLLKGYKNKLISFMLLEALIVILSIFFILPSICNSCSARPLDFVVSFSRTALLFTFGIILIHLFQQTRKTVFIFACMIITIFEFSFFAQNIPYLRMKTSYSDYYKRNSLIVETPTNESLFRYFFSENQYIYNTAALKVFNTQGYETVPYQGYYDLSRLGELKTLEFTNTKYLVTTTERKNEQLDGFTFLNIIDPKNLPEETFYGTVKNLAYFSPQTELPYYIYQINNYYPRFFVPSKAVSCTGECKEYTDPRITTYIQKSDYDDFTNPPTSDVNVEVTSYTPNTISLTVKTSQKTLIASSEMYDAGWSLIIDGKKAELLKSNGGFRAFEVPEGTSSIEMRYYPPFFNLGLLISASGVVLLALSYYFFLKIKVLSIPNHPKIY